MDYLLLQYFIFLRLHTKFRFYPKYMSNEFSFGYNNLITTQIKSITTFYDGSNYIISVRQLMNGWVTELHAIHSTGVSEIVTNTFDTEKEAEENQQWVLQHLEDILVQEI